PARLFFSLERTVGYLLFDRSGFTREYGSRGNGERRVEIGQQGRPFRGQARSYRGLCKPVNQ
ncbi:hypothetical protein, partial [Pseudomonas sp. M3]|uniref:hypothetical protein n=1 Tax=Pseudomonas sp. M3 TaxID=690137 RepID=UPI003834C5DB